ncbi:MAG: hypothetical protein DRP65_11275 [Planctomycetota bacterium]|nr:MAG: hypothetical protein DRP65_11275 [Planctomycetota bacterium]
MTICASPYIGFFRVPIKDDFPIKSCRQGAITDSLLTAKASETKKNKFLVSSQSLGMKYYRGKSVYRSVKRDYLFGKGITGLPPNFGTLINFLKKNEKKVDENMNIFYIL